MATKSAEPSRPEKSLISSAVESINFWGGGRPSSLVAPAPESQAPLSASGKSSQDHTQSHLYGISRKSYPTDCPPLGVLWFHAIDVPKRTPRLLKTKASGAAGIKPQAPKAKKFVAFSSADSRSIEDAFQRLLDDAESGRRNTSGNAQSGSGRVPVSEDFLFDVDIRKRELSPVFWEGPVYEVRRGSWFCLEGTVLKPCEENLASQLEEGYLKAKPWQHPAAPSFRRYSFPGKGFPKTIVEKSDLPLVASGSAVPPASPSSHRLFGSYMNNVVTYQDSTTAWLSSDSMLSWVTAPVYERFGAGGFQSGMKLIRGHADQSKTKDTKATASNADSTSFHEASSFPGHVRHDDPGSTVTEDQSLIAKHQTDSSRESQLKRQISAYLEGPAPRSQLQTDEHIRQKQEDEIRNDYNSPAGETQGREIDHLILATHGIGQLLGLKIDSVNFIHNINTMRKSLKSMYAASPDLQALNSDAGDGASNCRVQILPICWRHLLDFPKRRESKDEAEHDLADMNADENDYPALEDITVEGMAFARSLISDIALDVLLYQSAYREEICRIVLQQANRIYQLFRQRQPNFKGKIHLMGHSLGSAIMFDMLCRQPERSKDALLRSPLSAWTPLHGSDQEPQEESAETEFLFEVSDLYCLGSPIGLFQMIKGCTIAGRKAPLFAPAESSLGLGHVDESLLAAPPSSRGTGPSPHFNRSLSVSSPKIAQLFNIFHPSDPISYRLEPLISGTMSALKPQLLPYKKKSYLSSVSPQGLTNFGASFGQSVTGIFSSLSAGLSSNLLSKSPVVDSHNMTTAGSADLAVEPTSESGGYAGNLIDLSKDSTVNGPGEVNSEPADELESLYVQFQKKRQLLLARGGDSAVDKDLQLEERKAKRLRTEESKVRALNRNGRVDFCIQEGVLDFNPMNTLASHLNYWGDEDVNHFILTQLLSNKE